MGLGWLSKNESIRSQKEPKFSMGLAIWLLEMKIALTYPLVCTIALNMLCVASVCKAVVHQSSKKILGPKLPSLGLAFSGSIFRFGHFLTVSCQWGMLMAGVVRLEGDEGKQVNPLGHPGSDPTLHSVGKQYNRVSFAYLVCWMNTLF